MDSNITLQTKQMIDSLKAVCTNFGLGNASSEYKIITEVFLYKFLNDKFLFEAKRVEPALAKLSPADAEKQLAQMTDDDYELFLLGFGPDTAKLKQTHFISYLFNRKNEENFHTVFDDTLLDIATYNIDIFSVRTGGQSKMRLFSGISQHVIEAEKKDDFCRAIIDKIAECSFDSVFEQKYDFFAQIFEYLIKDYNKDFGKYAEYYTPHSIASIIAKIMVPNGAKNVTVYDPAAGSGTLVLALAHEIGESNCTIYTQDISQKSNEFLRLNLILNNLVHSLPNVVHDDTLLRPYHKNAKGDGLATFDYIVSNPPFNMDFSDSRDTPKPERLIERIIHIASNPGDLVLDSFLGSGTTAAVAQKMGRRWIGVEMGNHAYTHCKVRMDKVIAGEDPGGITKAQNWQGGGGYRFYEVAPTLINKDSFDEYVINEDYDANMLAAAVALHEGFRYHPDGDLFWKQSVGNENSYLFVTTRHLNSPYLDSIKDTMEEGEYLIIACRSFDSGLDKAYDNITVKKIPQMLLERCEFGKADYNLNIVHPPVYDDCDEEEEDV